MFIFINFLKLNLIQFNEYILILILMIFHKYFPQIISIKYYISYLLLATLNHFLKIFLI